MFIILKWAIISDALRHRFRQPHLDQASSSAVAVWGKNMVFVGENMYPGAPSTEYLPTKLGDFLRANVGECSSTMEHLG